jgi:hypothetical protein
VDREGKGLKINRQTVARNMLIIVLPLAAARTPAPACMQLTENRADRGTAAANLLPAGAINEPPP